MQTLLKVSEAAQFLRVSPSLLYQLVERRRIPAVHVGCCIRFDPEELQRWVKSGGGPADGNNSPA